MIVQEKYIFFQPSDINNKALESLNIENKKNIIHTFKWAHEYLASSHPELGRDGPVCPFVPTSLKKQLFFICTPSKEIQSSPNQLIEYFEKLANHFHELYPKNPPDSLYKTIVTLLPNVQIDTLNAIQKSLKADYVEKGLMIGQFYKGCMEPGLWNKQFHPLQSPIPLMAIRTMVPNDFPFIQSEEESARMLLSYFNHFGGNIPKDVLAQIIKALQLLNK